MKKQITVTILPDGRIKFDNTKNPAAEKAILDELAELAELLAGDPQAFEVEKHVGGAHAHTHEAGHVHA